MDIFILLYLITFYVYSDCSWWTISDDVDQCWDRTSEYHRKSSRYSSIFFYWICMGNAPDSDTSDEYHLVVCSRLYPYQKKCHICNFYEYFCTRRGMIISLFHEYICLSKYWSNECIASGGNRRNYFLKYISWRMVGNSQENTIVFLPYFLFSVILDVI